MSSTSARRPRSVAKLKVVCPHHPDANLIEDYHAGDMICPECGLVVGDRVIDVGSEWRTFSNENGGDHKDQSRVGAAEHWLLGSDLFTMIGPGGKQLDDESGKPMYMHFNFFRKFRSNFNLNGKLFKKSPSHGVLHNMSFSKHDFCLATKIRLAEGLLYAFVF